MHMCAFCVHMYVGSHACMCRVKDNLCPASPYIDQAGPKSTEITDYQYKECSTSLSFYFLFGGYRAGLSSGLYSQACNAGFNSS